MTIAVNASIQTLRVIAADIKIAHSVFALPFAVLAAFMAAAPIEWSRFGGQLVLIVLAMVFARTVAMLANRLLDRRIDADNPRTAGRALPSGRLSVRAAVAALLFCTALFMGVCVAFGAAYGNWWPTALGLPVLAWIASYGLFKRFTALCHLWLGSSLAISPIAAALAIEPAALAQSSLWLLSLMVLTWVAGFDVIYALQDEAIDKRDGLHSIPAKLGTSGALLVSRVLHVIAIAALIGTAVVDTRLSMLFGVGVALAATLLLVEHATVSRWGTTKIALTFFTLNGVISCLLGTLGTLDILIG